MLANNLDLLLEVLSLLPTRSLIRFKSVCKRWQLVISDPYFIKTHRNRCNPYAMSGFRFSNQEFRHCYLLGGAHLSASAPDLSLSTLKDDAESMRVGTPFVYCLRSFYGLLICPLRLSRSDAICEFIYIFNPVTRQYKRIPHVDPQRYPSDIILTPDHQVIMFSRDLIHDYDADIDIRMYVPDTQSWKTLYSFRDYKKSQNCEWIFVQRNGVFLNGTVYQVMESDTIPSTFRIFPFRRKLYIFSFDLKSLSAQKLLLPHQCNDFHQENLYFGEIQGHLHLIMQQKLSNFIFHIMEIKEDFSGWNLLHCIDLINFMRDVLPPLQVFSPQKLMNSWEYPQIEYGGQNHLCALSPTHIALGEREDYELFLTVAIHTSQPYSCGSAKIFSYNIVSKTYQEILEVSDKEEYYGADNMRTYYPMLTTP
ncbi:F-box protein At5g07610-like [Dioscorea cayenensis subsp. rotundata]|uniref:F-box protein At5g07610-like n=1 Tax=Dioscorea cayennensis subsp. rotundata TaxID=55577 RepID=A0AB40AW53_DIOCR|nr:F-box protein At5g07610-like [Dioscorea cayenensis subsp. rotundata]